MLYLNTSVKAKAVSKAFFFFQAWAERESELGPVHLFLVFAALACILLSISRPNPGAGQALH